MVSHAFDTQLTLSAAVTVTQPEPDACDRPLRVGVLLEPLKTSRRVARILHDINAAPFLTVSFVIVDATDVLVPAACREWSRGSILRSSGRPRDPLAARDGMHR
jgi:hypothetical protein